MQVWHMCGAGNSFAVIDARGLQPEFPALAQRLCNALNTDGFMALGKSENADLRLHFYNRDGSRAAFCGNGARCLCRFARENDLAGDTMTLQTDAGLLTGQRLSPSRYRTSLPQPESLAPGLIKVGVPHLLVRLPGLTFSMRDALQDRAAALREQWDANVNFYTPLGPGRIRLLTYERGVEAFTLACGSGCGAVAAHLGPGRWRIQTPGGTLGVDNTASSLSLTGPTKVVQVITL